MGCSVDLVREKWLIEYVPKQDPRCDPFLLRFGALNTERIDLDTDSAGRTIGINTGQ